MSDGTGVSERLQTLRKLDASEVAPLWIEALSLEEALAELSGRRGPVFDLQRARFLAELGRHAEAAVILDRTGDLSRGLAAVRDRLRESLASPASETAVAARQEGQRPQISPTPTDRLGRWLDRVNRWRSELRV